MHRLLRRARRTRTEWGLSANTDSQREDAPGTREADEADWFETERPLILADDAFPRPAEQYSPKHDFWPFHT